MDRFEHKIEKSNIPVCNILGVEVAAIDMEWLLAYTQENLSLLSGDYLCVSNVHTTVMAYEDPSYLAIQNGAVMAIPDGGPLSSVGRKRGHKDMRRVTGPSYMNEMLSLSREKGYRHFFLGSTEETLAKMREILEKDYPEVPIAGMFSPPFRAMTDEEDRAIIQMINDAEPDFIWVGLGAPKQELWMAAHQWKVKGFMVGVGAGLDYFAGNIKRAPLWMQERNLEWLYRLLQDPKRLFWRYFYSNTKFIWNVLIRGK